MSETTDNLEKVDYTEGGVSLKEGGKYKLMVPLPAVKIGAYIEGVPAGGELTLKESGGGDYQEAIGLTGASAGEDGWRDLVYEEARGKGPFDCSVQPKNGSEYFLFRERERPPYSQADARLARVVPLTLHYESENKDDQVPVAEKHVALELASAEGKAWVPFKTDGDGLVRIAVEGEEPGDPVYVLHPEEQPKIKVAVQKKEPLKAGEEPEEDRIQEVPVVELPPGQDGKPGETAHARFVATVKRPPRLAIPIRLGRMGLPDVQRRGRGFSWNQQFKVRVDGEEIACGTKAHDDGLVEVVFRCERGQRKIEVASVPVAQQEGSEPRETLYFSRKLTVK